MIEQHAIGDTLRVGVGERPAGEISGDRVINFVVRIQDQDLLVARPGADDAVYRNQIVGQADAFSAFDIQADVAAAKGVGHRTGNGPQDFAIQILATPIAHDVAPALFGEQCHVANRQHLCTVGYENTRDRVGGRIGDRHRRDRDGRLVEHPAFGPQFDRLRAIGCIARQHFDIAKALQQRATVQENLRIGGEQRPAVRRACTRKSVSRGIDPRPHVRFGTGIKLQQTRRPHLGATDRDLHAIGPHIYSRIADRNSDCATAVQIQTVFQFHVAGRADAEQGPGFTRGGLRQTRATGDGDVGVRIHRHGADDSRHVQCPARTADNVEAVICRKLRTFEPGNRRNVQRIGQNHRATAQRDVGIRNQRRFGLRPRHAHESSGQGIEATAGAPGLARRNAQVAGSQRRRACKRQGCLRIDPLVDFSTRSGHQTARAAFRGGSHSRIIGRPQAYILAGDGGIGECRADRRDLSGLLSGRRERRTDGHAAEYLARGKGFRRRGIGIGAKRDPRRRAGRAPQGARHIGRDRIGKPGLRIRAVAAEDAA